MKKRTTDAKVSINTLSNELMSKIDELKQQYALLNSSQKKKIIGGISAVITSITTIVMIKKTVKHRKMNSLAL